MLLPTRNRKIFHPEGIWNLQFRVGNMIQYNKQKKNGCTPRADGKLQA